MADVERRDPDLSTIHPDTTPVVWEDAMYLDQLLSNLFFCYHTDLNSRSRRLSPHFTAAEMVKICGLKLKWTESLADHLRLDR